MAPAISGGKAAHALYRDEELGTSLTEKAVAWMREKKDAPFFLYFATPHIHHPFTPAARFKGTSECGRYGDFIHELDWMVGEVMRTLDELELREKTLVIFTSDNGGATRHGANNTPLRGQKGQTFEGGVRVPTIVRWPGVIPAGSETSKVSSHMDFLPTFAKLVQAELPANRVLDGVDLWPIISGLHPDAAPRRHNVKDISHHRSNKGQDHDGQNQAGGEHANTNIRTTKQDPNDGNLP